MVNTGNRAKKTSHVSEDEQLLKNMKKCLGDLWETHEIIHFGETDEQKAEADPVALLRQIRANSGLLYGRRPRNIKKEHRE
jgi:hypothetical protein